MHATSGFFPVLFLVFSFGTNILLNEVTTSTKYFAQLVPSKADKARKTYGPAHQNEDPTVVSVESRVQAFRGYVKERIAGAWSLPAFEKALRESGELVEDPKMHGDSLWPEVNMVRIAELLEEKGKARKAMQGHEWDPGKKERTVK